MPFMQVDRPSLVADLKGGVAEVIFIKNDGERRILKCTLQTGYLPEEYKNTLHENSDGNQDVLAVWDVENNGWRSFRLDRVLSIQQVFGW